MKKFLLPLFSLLILSSTFASADGGFSANISAGDDNYAPISMIATSEKHPADDGSGYKMIFLHFYPFELSEEELAAIQKDGTDALKDKIYSDMKNYYSKTATFYMTVNSDGKIQQMDISVPGTTCTVAWREDDLNKYIQDSSVTQTHISLKTSGEYECDSVHKTFKWNLDIDAPLLQGKE